MRTPAVYVNAVNVGSEKGSCTADFEGGVHAELGDCGGWGGGCCEICVWVSLGVGGWVGGLGRGSVIEKSVNWRKWTSK